MLGNLNDHTIHEILQGPVLQQVRDTIRKGRLHPQYCYNCIAAERYGRSERDWHNDVNPDFDVAAADDSDHRPAIVDVRWNTTCNLSCNYCGEKCSSRWASLKHIPVRSGTRPYFKDVCDYLDQHTHAIREVALVGGEPLLLPENETVCDVVPESAVITLITNLAVDLERNGIFQRLAKRPRVGWSVSFDNIGPRFEYVRHGAQWSLLQNNLAQVRDLIHHRGHWGGIHAVYNVYNATRLVEFTEFAREQQLAVHWQSLYQPDYLDPRRLGPELQNLARAEIQRLLSMNICTDSEREFFQQVLAAPCPPVPVNFRPQLVQHIEAIETQWHPDCQGFFPQLWPELAWLLAGDSVTGEVR